MGDVTPDQIATFDQALADVENNLDVLIDLWRTGDPDSPEHIRIAGLCVALGDSEWDRIAFVEILVAAIRRLDRPGQAATPDGPRRPNGPMVARLRACAADTSPNWDGAVTVYPPEARELVALIDHTLTDATPVADGQDGDGRG